MCGFLKLATATSPFNLVSSIFKLNLLFTNSFLTSACRVKSKRPCIAPLGKLGSLMSKLPASLGKSKIRFSRLPLKGEENLPLMVRLPCTPAISPVMPLLCTALGEPLMSASTKLALKVSPALSCDKLTVTFLPVTSFFCATNSGAFKSSLSLAPLNCPETASFKLSIKNSRVSGFASISPLAVISTSLPPNKSPLITASRPFATKCLVSGSTKKLPLSLALAESAGWFEAIEKSVTKSTGSAKAIWPEVKLNLESAYLAPEPSSV